MIVSRGEVAGALAAAGSFLKDDGGLRTKPSEEEVVRYHKMISMMPFVRRERIAAIQHALAARNYNINAGEVADKMVDRSLLDAVLAHAGSWP